MINNYTPFLSPRTNPSLAEVVRDALQSLDYRPLADKPIHPQLAERLRQDVRSALPPSRRVPEILFKYQEPLHNPPASFYLRK